MLAVRIHGPYKYVDFSRCTGNHPLHVAIRLMREDVIFLCLMENDQSVSSFILCG